MKPKKILYVTAITLLLTGCSGKAESNDTLAKSTSSPTSKPVSSNTDTNDTKDENRDLTSEELADFTTFIQDRSNYGFLLSEYDNPIDVDLSEVLYAGAGIQAESLSDDEVKAYLTATDADTIFTDCLRLTSKQIDDFFKKKTGLSFNDVKAKFSWLYLEQYDIWVLQRGDTNYVGFVCGEGKYIGNDTYVLKCYTSEEYRSDCELTIKKVKNSYQFVSNKFIEKTGKYYESMWNISHYNDSLTEYYNWLSDDWISEDGDTTYNYNTSGYYRYTFTGLDTSSDIPYYIFYANEDDVRITTHEGTAWIDVLLKKISENEMIMITQDNNEITFNKNK